MGLETTGKKRGYKKWWVWVLAVVILIRIASQAGNKHGQDTASTQTEGTSEEAALATETEAPPAIKVTVITYYDEYVANEVAAVERNKGKDLEIMGEVTGFEKTLGTVSVNLKCDELIGWVHCGLEDESDASKISKGQCATLVGRGEWKMGFARVEDCKIK